MSLVMDLKSMIGITSLECDGRQPTLFLSMSDLSIRRVNLYRQALWWLTAQTALRLVAVILYLLQSNARATPLSLPNDAAVLFNTRSGENLLYLAINQS